MGSLKVNITCGGENMEVQQLQIEPENWHHRFEISVVSKMVNNKNVIRIEMTEVPQNTEAPQNKTEEQIQSIPKTHREAASTPSFIAPKIPTEKETTDAVDGSVWL